MNVAVIVATYGDECWRKLGDVTSMGLMLAGEAREVVRLHLPDGTLAEARNTAAAATRADWLCFLDSDDTLEPGYLDAMAAPAREGEGLLVPAVRYISHGKSEPPVIPNLGGWPRINECVIGTLIPRLLFLELGGFREWPSIEDYDLYLRAYDAGLPLIYVPDAVYRATVNPLGRNRDQSCYQTIWAEHVARVKGIR